MVETVELIFKREASKERPRELLFRFAREQQSKGSTEWDIFDKGIASRSVYGVDEPIWISFRSTFFLGSKHFITRRPDGGVHILEHRQVDKAFFELFRYPDPGPLWDLIQIVKRRTERSRRFLGPSNLRNRVRRVTDADRESFDLRPDPYTWQAIARCACDSETFYCKYLGTLDNAGTVCNSSDMYQRTDLFCTSCNTSFLLFDATLNGYDAAICNWPPVREERREAVNEYLCACHCASFHVAVAAVYDAEPDILSGLAARQKDESFGWFTAMARCSTCGLVRDLIDYECA